MNVITDAERIKIQHEAEEILKKFSMALANVKIPKKDIKEKASGWREEEQGKKGDVDFRERMFANAPKHDSDAILAEKKKW